MTILEHQSWQLCICLDNCASILTIKCYISIDKTSVHQSWDMPTGVSRKGCKGLWLFELSIIFAGGKNKLQAKVGSYQFFLYVYTISYSLKMLNRKTLQENWTYLPTFTALTTPLNIFLSKEYHLTLLNQFQNNTYPSYHSLAPIFISSFRHVHLLFFLQFFIYPEWQVFHWFESLWQWTF